MAIVEENTMLDGNDACVEQIANANRELAIQEENESLKSRLMYLQADFDNFKKRISKEKQDAYSAGKEDAIFAMLESIDCMELLLKSLKDDPTSNGFKMIHSNLVKALFNLGCKQIKCNVGDEFDYNVHEALASVESAIAQNNHIVEINKTGWTLDGKLLRPTLVTIAK